MKCSHCGFDKNPESARFCVGCGKALVEHQQVVINVSQSAGEVATGGKAEALHVQEMHGVTIVQGDPEHTSLMREVLAAVKALSTEVRPSPTGRAVATATEAGAAAAAAKAPQELESIRHTVDQLLEIVTAQNAHDFQIGEFQTSRAELLLKKAVLLKTDGEQLMLDDVIAIAKAQQAGASPRTPDTRAAFTKLEEAYSLLEEALKLDAGNTEVMLHMVEIRSTTHVEDPREAERLLFRIHNLLNPPKSDTEKFRLAQAKVLQGVLRGKVNQPDIQAARAMFEQLGRVDWVQHCDRLLQQPGSPTAAFVQGAGALAVFQPIGRWQVRANDGGMAFVEFYPNGAFTSTMQGGIYGYAQSAGQWGFMPSNNFLRLQGLVNGLIPFDLGMVIQGQQNGVYMAMGTDGKTYFFQRMI